MKVVIDIKEETYILIRETIAFWRSDERYTVAPIGWQEIADSKPYEEQPHGEWIDHSDEGYVECPFCGSATTCEDNKDELHYCWNCGAEMRQEETKDDG